MSARGEILRLTQVGFSYPAQENGLRGVSLSVGRGERVALVGPSGSGKSTALKLIDRLEHGYTGSIMFAGRELTRYSHDELTAAMTLVPQAPFILRRSVAANIAFGEDVSREAIERAARAANAADFIEAMPDRYDTQLGEFGSTLSGGQQQRICLARALVRKPALLLLDEPTSGLDNESQSIVQAAIDNLSDVAIIEVAHRLSTVERADRIIVLDHGVVVEAGSFDELRSGGGVFSRLLRLERQDTSAA